MKEQKKRSDQENQSQTSAETVAFTNWFSKTIRDHRQLKATHYATVLAFFKDNDLSEQEPAEKYDAMLKVFGF